MRMWSISVLAVLWPDHSLRHTIDTLRPRQNGRKFPDDIFKYIFLQENVSISIKISLKFVPKGSINNIPALVQIMAWRRSCDKPLSEPMMVSLPVYRRIYASLDLNELTDLFIFKIVNDTTEYLIPYWVNQLRKQRPYHWS